jgi:hypothetical protein
MNKHKGLQRIGLLVLLTIALLFIADIQAIAQKKDYKPGEKIEYLAETYPKEVWEVGTFVEASPGGSQPVIRQKPNEFFKEGFQLATQWEKIRPLGAGKATADTERKTQETKNKENTAETTNDFGTGLMTKEQVLHFLQTKLGDKPFENPRREAVIKELNEMIKARGVDFRSSEMSQEYSRNLYAANGSGVLIPLSYNYGEPTKQSWLMGAWRLDKIGAAVDYVKNNRVYRQGEIGVGNVGTLTLNANGTYVWKAANAKDSTDGKWRQATSEEMNYQGGFQIVLLKAKYGEDWIVMKNTSQYIKWEAIVVAQVNSRAIKEHGSRGGKK